MVDGISEKANLGMRNERSLRSRADTKERFIKDLEAVKDKLEPLHQKTDTARKLQQVVTQLEQFIQQITVLATRQEKQALSSSVDQRLVTQSRILERVTPQALDPINNQWEIALRLEVNEGKSIPFDANLNRMNQLTESSGQQNEKGQPRSRVMDAYKALFPRSSSDEIASDSTDQPLTSDSLAEQARQVEKYITEQFKETLDSSLPQLEALLKTFYPKENEEIIRRRETLFLRSIGQYLRLEQAAVKKIKKLGVTQMDGADEYGKPINTRTGYTVESMQAHLLSGIITYLVDTSDQCQEVRADLGASKGGEIDGLVTKRNIDALLAQYETEEIVLRKSKNVRKQEYRQWIVQRAGEDLRVAGSPEDQGLIEQIFKRRRMKPFIGGVAAVGPPGTGKTEKIIEANRQIDRKTRVISMHKYSDFAQLMGESPIFLEGLKNDSSQLDRVQAFQDLLKRPDQELAQFFKNVKAMHEKLLSLTPEVALQIKLQAGSDETAVAREISEDLMLPFIQELRAAIDTQLVTVLLSDGSDTEKQTAWVKGEIQRAIDNGEMALLDEADKAPSSAFDGLAALLSKRPGEEVDLGGQKLHIPHWFRIDMTVNQNNLPPHMKDRFTELYCGYPSTEDLLWKLGLFLAKDDGEMAVSLETEWKMTLLFTYVVPRIQALYAEEKAKYDKAMDKSEREGSPAPRLDMQPLSMRGITTICSRVAKGDPIGLVIDEEILTPGRLAPAGTPVYEKLQKIISAFGSVKTMAFFDEDAGSLNRIDRMVQSPIYNSIAQSESTEAANAINSKRLRRVSITEEQRNSLSKQERVPQFAIGEPYALASGLIVTQEVSNAGLKIGYSYPQGEKTRVFFTQMYPDLSQAVSIIGAGQFGEELVIKDQAGNIEVLMPFTQHLRSLNNEMLKESAFKEIPGLKDPHISKDGRTILGFVGAAETLQARVQVRGKEHTTTFSFQLHGQDALITEAVMNQDGSMVVLTTRNGESYLFSPASELMTTSANETEKIVQLQSLLPDSGTQNWKFAGNTLFSRNSNGSVYTFS